LVGFLGSLAVNYIDLNTDRDQYEDDWSDDEDGDGGPAMAGTRMPGYMNSTAATHYVYVLREGNHPRGRVDYVGITTDPASRSVGHKRRCFTICDSKFTERQARSMESALMTKFPGAKRAGGPAGVQIRKGLRNKRLSIGRKHHFFTSALEDGIRLLREVAPDIIQQIP
jgi:hypothetical protein